MKASKLKLRMKREVGAEKPTVWIGKEGVDPRIMGEISRQLDKREIVKIRVLKSALGKEGAKTMAARIAEETASTLIDVRGHTFVLYKPRKRRGSKKSL